MNNNNNGYLDFATTLYNMSKVWNEYTFFKFTLKLTISKTIDAI